jgi:hypothetical protein
MSIKSANIVHNVQQSVKVDMRESGMSSGQESPMAKRPNAGIAIVTLVKMNFR